MSQPPRGPFVISPRVHADKKVTFSYLAPFAKQVLLGGSQFGAAQVPMIKEFQKNFTNWSPDADKINNQLKLFTISVGTEDFLYESVKKNIAMFEEKKIKVKPFIVSGGHTWMNCKLFLATTLQEIFK
jgi:hypothetical protein